MKIIKLACVALLLPSVSACRVVELRNPGPIAAASTPEITNTAIEKALANRGWLIAKEEPGKVYATLHLRSHTAKILISYDADQIEIEYMDSDNLKYRKDKKGKEYIHKNYLSWVKNLLKDISKYSST